jgi:hypothetical protein
MQLVPFVVRWETRMPVGEMSGVVPWHGFVGVGSLLPTVHHSALAAGECAGSRRVSWGGKRALWNKFLKTKHLVRQPQADRRGRSR